MRKAVFLTFCIILIFSASVLAQGQFATVLKTMGGVNVRPSGTFEYSVPADMGMGLMRGDAIKTDETGFAAIIFNDDKSMLKIRKDSEIEIKEDFSVRSVSVTEGRVLAKVTPGLLTSYRIETPTSVASVKGTEFWVVTSAQFGDRFFGISGVVEVLNLITGIEISLNPGQMVISTPDGQLLTIPVDPEDIPEDVEEEEPPQPEPEPEAPVEEEPEEVYEPGEEDVLPEEVTEAITPEIPPEELAKKGEKPYGLGLGLGSVTIDGVIYNQIALRPELKLGKLGVGLDVVLYMDDKGKIRRNEWDEFSDYLDKIYYLRWAQQGDPFFARVGALDNVTLGYGILMSGYSNTTEYPQVRKVGFHTGMQFKKLGWEAFMANVKELTGPGLLGGRVTYQPLKNLPLKIGGTLVADFYPYKGLPDSDDDDVADALDMYPDEDDNDVIDDLKTTFTLDQREYLRSIGYDMPTEDVIEKGITRLSDYDRIMNGAISFDIGMPVFNSKFLKLNVYGQAASFIPVEDSALVYDSNTGLYSRTPFTPGYGLTIPGVRANLFQIANLAIEYRYAGENFLFSYWDRAYDFERVQIRNNRIYTKQQMKLMQESMQGAFGSFDVNILNYLILGAYYQHMITGSSDEMKSFMATASIPKGKIPKLANALAFYQRNNDDNPFDFKNPSENTIMGYKIGFEIGGGAVISYVFQTTYRDLDGSGDIDPETEAISLTTIETGFSF